MKTNMHPDYNGLQPADTSSTNEAVIAHEPFSVGGQLAETILYRFCDPLLIDQHRRSLRACFLSQLRLFQDRTDQFDFPATLQAYEAVDELLADLMVNAQQQTNHA